MGPDYDVIVISGLFWDEVKTVVRRTHNLDRVTLGIVAVRGKSLKYSAGFTGPSMGSCSDEKR